MKIIAVCVVLFVVRVAAIGCDCGWGGPFIEMASSEGALVVIARVQEYRYINVPLPKPGQSEDSHPPLHSPDAMVLKIESVLKGECSASELLVFGDNGMQCRPYVDRFEVGTEWAFVLHGSKEEYFVSVCGEFWLEGSQGKFKGVIEGKNPKRRHTITLEELKKKIRANQPPQITTGSSAPDRV